MSRVNFRVKVDLSAIYRDARQCNLVYIDAMYIKHIKQLKEHLINLFKLEEPFHLMSTGDTYLPPEEDVRVLEKNDLVIVIPGTGLQSTAATKVNTHFSIKNCYANFDNDKNANGDISQTKRSLYITMNDNKDIAEEAIEEPPNITVDTNIRNATVYHSILDTTTEMNSSDSKETDGNGTIEDYGTDNKNTVTQSRKRVRRKRTKKDKQLTDCDTNVTIAKKLKTVNNIITPSGKHIRFSAAEKDKALSETEKMGLVQEELVSVSNKATPAKHLGKLLALAQTSTPITFSSRVIKKEINTDAVESPLTTVNTIVESNDNMSKETCSEKSTQMPKVGDIIEFKMLVMGSDYCPTVSDIITAEVMNFSSVSSEYILKMTRGKEQLIVPNGKFTLPESNMEMNGDTSIIHLNNTEFIDLQIIKTAK